MNNLENTTNQSVTEFLSHVLTKKTGLIESFKEKEHLFEFNEENEKPWQFIVLKSLDHEFSYLQPLANYLLDNKYCLISSVMVQYATLNGFKIESEFNKLKEPFNAVNKITKEFGFDEKLVLVNYPVENILSLVKK